MLSGSSIRLTKRLQFLNINEAILVRIEPVKERGGDFFGAEFPVVVSVTLLEETARPASAALTESGHAAFAGDARGFVREAFEGGEGRGAIALCLHHEDTKELVGLIEPELGAVRAAPGVVTFSINHAAEAVFLTELRFEMILET
jgi:hypothetical protein